MPKPILNSTKIGAGTGNRTRTPLLERDFKSLASASSAIPATDAGIVSTRMVLTTRWMFSSLAVSVLHLELELGLRQGLVRVLVPPLVRGQCLEQASVPGSVPCRSGSLHDPFRSMRPG